MTKLILIRHGRTLWNSSGKFQGQSDIELSQEGISQAEKLAENFPVTHIDRVYSSNLKRAYITGEIIAKKFNVPIIKDKRLCEVSFGSWEGLTYDEIHEKWPNEIETMFSTPDVLTMPEGESFAQVQKRGLGKAFHEYSSKKSMAFALLFTFIISLLLGTIGVIALIFTIIVMYLFNRYVANLIGGLTGDVYGATAEIGELVVLFVFVLAQSFI